MKFRGCTTARLFRNNGARDVNGQLEYSIDSRREKLNLRVGLALWMANAAWRARERLFQYATWCSRLDDARFSRACLEIKLRKYVRKLGSMIRVGTLRDAREM